MPERPGLRRMDAVTLRGRRAHTPAFTNMIRQGRREEEKEEVEDRREDDDEEGNGRDVRERERSVERTRERKVREVS